ncbi:cell wall-binding repeat-containing protein [Rossellomorea aquimaris]|uniref:Trifunctional nucleotide phosphoesterase protein YfkN n=1 Tax=Rossellomorea aquimaris TaxID=189382 RepID=A0A5D4TRR7_9BACI|nr:cell wall-binding repeat-containing protein [Rossellomorea aquimaris]TYS78540.1 hypothetical protein FZC80_12415 [Rossellomorea aquimaris]
MKKSNLLTKLVAAGVLLSTAVAPNVLSVSAAETANTTEVQLLSVNDLHGKIDQEYKIDVNGDEKKENIGRMDYLAAHLKQREAENPNTLIVHSGDMIGGSPPVAALLQDEPVVEIMNAMGFDVGVPGNHEFDEGVEELLRILNGGDHPTGTEGYAGQDFPLTAANVEYKDTGKLMLDPYHIEEVDGKKIGFIGVVTTDTPNMVMPAGIESIQFTDEAAAVNKYSEELKSQGVKAIVVLAHVPGGQDDSLESTGAIKALAESVDDEVDVIYAGHDHMKINDVVDNKLIVQASDYGKAFADVDMTLDAEGQVIEKKAEIVDVLQEGITPDPTVNAILTKYQDEVAPIINEVVGEAAAELKGGYGTKGEIGDNALGNLIADGMMWAMDADFALMNGGGIRDDLNAGDITWGELYNIQPFGNILTKVDIKGKDLYGILSEQIDPQYGPDYSVGGFSYTWASYDGTVDIFLPDGSEIDKDETYSLVVNNYMWTSTGDKYTTLQAEGKNAEIGPIDVDATVDYVKSFDGPIAYEAEGRISQVMLPVERVSGADRYETAVSISSKGWKKSDTVILARGDSYPDALAGTPLAHSLNAPILLTENDTLNKDTLAEIQRLGAENVIILGGTAAISSGVQSALKDKVKNVKRIDGSDRFQTAVNIAAEMEQPGEKAILVYGQGYADSMTIASYAAGEEYPIYLTETDELSPETKEALKKYSEVIVIGGTAAVSDDVFKDIPVKKMRIGGADRFETSRKIIEDLNIKPETIMAATSHDFADGLTGSVLAAKWNGTVLLTKPDSLPAATSSILENDHIEKAMVLGGTKAVSNEVMKDIQSKFE